MCLLQPFTFFCTKPVAAKNFVNMHVVLFFTLLVPASYPIRIAQFVQSVLSIVPRFKCF